MLVGEESTCFCAMYERLLRYGASIIRTRSPVAPPVLMICLTDTLDPNQGVVP